MGNFSSKNFTFIFGQSRRPFVFVNFAIGGGYEGVNHGIAYLTPIVRRYCSKVILIDIREDIGIDAFRTHIERINPAIVGYSFTSPQEKFINKYSKSIEHLKSTLQIAGGVGASLSNKSILKQTSVHGVSIGEGEIPLENLLKTIKFQGDIYKTNGFFWRVNDKIIHNEISNFVKNLDDLSFPEYGIFDSEVVISGYRRNLNLILGRGCPYNCTYCANKAIKDLYTSTKGYFRLPSVEYSIRLIMNTIDQYPETKYISFEDDLMIANQKWFLKFAKEYRRQISLPYRLCVRTECINATTVKALKESGCVLAYLGLESGNEWLRKEVLNRHHSNQQIISKSKMIKESGIRLFTFNMVGLPFETKEMMMDTLELNKKIQADEGVCTFFYPLPGTELYRLCIREGLIIENSELPSNYNTSPSIAVSHKQKKEIIAAQKSITRYLRWGKFKNNLTEVRASRLGLNSLLRCIQALIILIFDMTSSPFKEHSIYSRIKRNQAIAKIARRLTSFTED